MKPSDLLLRCLAQKDGDVWVTSCLDLCLAAQADTLEEAKQKLEAMISDYVYDALIGEDRDYAGQLMTRKAPFREWVKYYLLLAIKKIGGMKDGVHQQFIEPLPMGPLGHCK